MLQFPATPLATLASLVLAMPFATLAQTAPPRAPIEGRAALLQACPQAAEELQETLRHHVLRRGEQGRMTVRFTLQGGRISEVEASGGPRSYQPYVRRAVAGLQCRATDEQAQSHHFEINFVRA